MGYRLDGFENKVAVVTGAGRMRGIGRSIALALARAGCDLVITGTGKSPEKYPDDEKEAGWRDIDSVADEIRALGRRAAAVVCDVSDGNAVLDLADRVMDEYGRVDFLINNASLARGDDRMDVVDVDPAIWRKVHDVNFNGSFYMCRAFGRKLIDQGQGGAIVNISSVAGKLNAAGIAAYSSSKSALQSLTAAMSGEVGRFDIRINAVCPGFIDTSRLDDIPRGNRSKIIRKFIPLGRVGEPEDIAAMVVFLCSDQASWLSGQLISVDGGQTAGL